MIFITEDTVYIILILKIEATWSCLHQKSAQKTTCIQVKKTNVSLMIEDTVNIIFNNKIETTNYVILTTEDMVYIIS